MMATRSGPRIDLDAVKALALADLDGLVHELVPGAQAAGNVWSARNPTRADRKAGSFVVWRTGPARGAFKEFAAGDDERGDVIDLVSYCLTGGAGFKARDARRRAIDWLRRRYGLDRQRDAEVMDRVQRAKRQIAEDRSEADRRELARARAFEHWAGARPIRGTLAETYLAWRGIRLDRIPHLEADLRFLARFEWWMGATRRVVDGRKVRDPGPSFPAMIAAFRDRDGRFRAIHVTFLAQDGLGKAPVAKPKLIWPDYAGAMIRLARGTGNATCEEAAEQGLAGPVVITEGIEDGLTLAQGAPHLRVWAAGALANIANAPALPCVTGFLVHEQNDWTSPAATAAFGRALDTLAVTGLPVATIPAFAGKDANDTLNWDG